MSLLEKLQGKTGSLIQHVENRTVDIGDGVKRPAIYAEVMIGGKRAKCTTVQNRNGEWQDFNDGDPRACEILRTAISEVSSPSNGPSTSDKLKEIGPNAGF